MITLPPLPILVTERLTLRQLRPDDANELVILRSDATVNQYLDRPKTVNLEEAHQFVENINQNITEIPRYYWAISLHDDDRLIGTTCMFRINLETKLAEIGYELHPNFQGKGIMQEAVSAIINFGFNRLNLDLLLAFTKPENAASVRLLTRNNFRHDTDFQYATPKELGAYNCFFCKKS